MLRNSSSFFFSSRRRHTRCLSDWSSDVCSSDLVLYTKPAHKDDIPVSYTGPPRSSSSPIVRRRPSRCILRPHSMILTLLILGGLLAFANGANDNAKGVATLVGFGAAKPRNALAWAALTT